MNTKDEFLEDGVTPNPDYVKPVQETEEERIERLVEERSALKLKDIKAKLDTSYSARDTALAEAETLKLEKKEAARKKAEAENDHKTLSEMRIAEAEEKLARAEARAKALEDSNTTLARDNSLRSALSTLSFRSEKAAEMAYRDIVGDLEKDEHGTWTHKTGVSIRDYVAAFAKDESQSFLFKVKESGGGGSSKPAGKAAPSGNTPLSKMKLSEVLKGIEDGSIKTR
jgi:hypothetical protein